MRKVHQRGDPGRVGAYEEYTLATCSLDLTAWPFTEHEDNELPNVCWLSSGEPNSRAFHCIVEPGAGFAQIQKEVPEALWDTDVLFGFTLYAAATNGNSMSAVEEGVTSGLIPVEPGTYTLTETFGEGWQPDGATCEQAGQTIRTWTFQDGDDPIIEDALGDLNGKGTCVAPVDQPQGVASTGAANDADPYT